MRSVMLGEKLSKSVNFYAPPVFKVPFTSDVIRTKFVMMFSLEKARMMACHGVKEFRPM